MSAFLVKNENLTENLIKKTNSNIWIILRAPIPVSDVNHLTQFNSMNNICPACGKRYKHKHHLKRHRDFECGIQPRFSCVYCSHKARYKDSLLKHIMARHDRVWNRFQQSHTHQYVDSSSGGDFDPISLIDFDMNSDQ